MYRQRLYAQVRTFLIEQLQAKVEAKPTILIALSHIIHESPPAIRKKDTEENIRLIIQALVCQPHDEELGSIALHAFRGLLSMGATTAVLPHLKELIPVLLDQTVRA